MRHFGRHRLSVLAVKVVVVFAGAVLSAGGVLEAVALGRDHHGPGATGDLFVSIACVASGLGLVVAGALHGRDATDRPAP